MSGVDALRDGLVNRGLGFTNEDRAAKRIRGLLPPAVYNLELQVQLALENLTSKTTPLEKYLFLTELQDLNEHLFFELVGRNPALIMPLIYTPTVGLACQRYSHILRRPRGMFISLNDRGHIAELLDNWPQKDVRAIVVTDGERILGLGDLGCNGMGIPVGKLSLYTACAGIDPSTVLPVTLDVGTNTQSILEDPFYIGLRQKRIGGAEYDEFVKEFVMAAHNRYPHILIQFEDFGNNNCFRLLDHWREKVCCFNDDIQGTGAVTLAGLLAAVRVKKTRLSDETILFFGAGSAAVGIAHQIMGMMQMLDGTAAEDTVKKIWFVDSQGLVVKSRTNLVDYKLEFAHDAPQQKSLLESVKGLKPTALIGVSGQGQTFTQDIVTAMASFNAKPIIFSLSNPTTQSECTAEQAYRWTNGAVLFASGSPFDPVTIGDKTYIPGQCNNVYIFPGVGLGVIQSKAKHVTDAMFLEAARVLSSEVAQSDLDSGCLFPQLNRVREVSTLVGAAVAKMAWEIGVAQVERPAGDLLEYIKSVQYVPSKAATGH
eukprot:TRINITY_DN7599_c0_g1_i1.p1 TRINITY_DN7599_c0_g1~~TRINITY_DN7599_c0_g1_i1.p1  ORF type:complete len:542 (+),score=137.21 TRINITY_DN7599_c0_g1_i1:50-1675(+)